MLPIVLDASKVVVGLAGRGPGLERRRKMLADAGIEPVEVSSSGIDELLPALSLLYVAGLGSQAASTLAARARAEGVLVNVEDVPELCDFHVPAVVRRGDLLLTVSTAGRSPGLVRQVREWLEARFGPEWSGRVDTAAALRQGWRQQGLDPEKISARTRRLVTEEGWLA